MGGSIKNIVKSPTRVVSAIGTGGMSEVYRRTIPGVKGIQNTGDKWLAGNRDSNPNLATGPGGQDPATMLAESGGAPLLANIALGVDPSDVLAGYFGKNSQDGSWQEFLNTLSQKDFDAINSVHGQL